MNSSIFNFNPNTRRLIGSFALIIGLFFSLDRALFFLFREAVYTFYSTSQKIEQSQKKIRLNPDIHYDTLIMGTSRTKEGIHPYYLHKYLNLKAYNAADAGRFPQYNYYFYREFKKINGVPRTLIYGFDYFTFAKDSNPIQLRLIKSQSNQSIQRLDVQRLANPNSIFLSKISLLYRAKPEFDQFMVDVIDSLSLDMVSAPNMSRSSGISKYRGKTGPVPERLRRKPHKWKRSSYPAYPGREGHFFKKLLDQLAMDGVMVVFVILPDYIGVYNTNFEHRKYHEDIKMLARTYSNIRLLDYNTPPLIDISNPGYFTDGQYGSRNSHLSLFGARLVNRRLCQDIQPFINP